MKPFVVNKHGRLVFPATVLGELDVSVLQTLDQLSAVISRDFEAKAPTGTDILERVEAGSYPGRFELLRDLGQNLFWVNRYSLPLYDKRPTRWRDVPRNRSDVFLPVLTPWQDGDRKVAAVEKAYRELPVSFDAETEDRIFGLLFDVFGHRRHHATELPAVKPTVAELLRQPGALTFVLPDHDPDFPVFGTAAVLDAHADVPELEALLRWAMVLHDQYPWDRSRTELRPLSEVDDDEFVVTFHPRNRDVEAFLERARSGAATRPAAKRAPVEAKPPIRPYPAVRVQETFAVKPRIESLAVARGEMACSNDDVIRNASFSWSPMSASEISRKTGIDARRYSARDLEELALDAARGALAHAGRAPEEIGAVLVATCTSTRLIPSVACWLSGELGILQTHASADIVAACAGMPYGLSEAVRLLQEVERPILLVCAEKFSDKIGGVRTSRMIFGDGAAAMVVAPAPDGDAGDIELLQTYASGPWSQVNSIIWPNPEFDNDITVYGPQVKALAGRYLTQMIDELGAMPVEGGGSVIDTVDLIVPHQANRTMIVDLAEKAGLREDQLYFNIADVGNVSSASIPLALYDAVRDGVVDRPMRVFAPGFGAGAVGGYAVFTMDPAIVAPEPAAEAAAGARAGSDGDSAPHYPPVQPTSDNVEAAFG
ncbi:MAG: 3-oxoacyl-ACP synthase III family protein [Pseudonocardia sp.]